MKLLRALGLALSLLPLAALAGPRDPMTRAEIISRARSGVSYGYFWGHGRWRTDGAQKGQCTARRGLGCPSCGFSGVDVSGNRFACTMSQNNEAGCYGADCSGYVAKAWALGTNDDVAYDEHPYSTSTFLGVSASLPWTRLRRRSELRPGDAFVRRGHMMIADKPAAGGKWWVWEAKGCKYGIVYNLRSVASTYLPIRRKLVEDLCTPSECSGHGNFRDCRCECASGYAGEQCDSCAPGYTGYPNCQPMGDVCRAVQEISCGQTIAGNNAGGTSQLGRYKPNCGTWDQTGSENVYVFKPSALSRVAVTITPSTTTSNDPDVMILTGTCNPDACFEYGDRSAAFTGLPGLSYYLVVDAASGYEGPFELAVTCTVGTQMQSKWIGETCTSNEECSYEGGFCHDTGGARFCSQTCTKYCPDRSGKAGAFCVADPENADRGVCVAKAETANRQCADVLGTTRKQLSRFNQPSTTSYVCVP